MFSPLFETKTPKAEELISLPVPLSLPLLVCLPRKGILVSSLIKSLKPAIAMQFTSLIFPPLLLLAVLRSVSSVMLQAVPTLIVTAESNADSAAYAGVCSVRNRR